MKPSYVEYAKAVSRLEDALNRSKDDYIRDSVIQRFEFSVELAWKTGKKFMGTGTSAPKDVLREMAQNGYIEDLDFWLRSIDMRNLTSHTYKEDLAEVVYTFAGQFVSQLKNLVRKFEQK